MKITTTMTRMSWPQARDLLALLRYAEEDIADASRACPGPGMEHTMPGGQDAAGTDGDGLWYVTAIPVREAIPAADPVTRQAGQLAARIARENPGLLADRELTMAAVMWAMSKGAIITRSWFGLDQGAPVPPGEVISSSVHRTGNGVVLESAPEHGSWPELGDGRYVSEICTAIRLVDAWLDASAAPAYKDQPLAWTWARITKSVDEAAEAKDALSGATGENPRKGVCDTWEHVLEELGDTACAALLGIQHRTKDTNATWAVFIAALGKALGRVPQQRPAPVITTTEGDTRS